jgi:hypothetical protein
MILTTTWDYDVQTLYDPTTDDDVNAFGHRPEDECINLRFCGVESDVARWCSQIQGLVVVAATSATWLYKAFSASYIFDILRNVSICDAVMRSVKENTRSLATDRPPRVQKAWTAYCTAVKDFSVEVG